MKRPAVRLWPAVLAIAGAIAGCSQGDPEECLREDEGEFFFSVQPVPSFPVGTDSTANLAVTLQNAVLDTILARPSLVPPVILYRFHATGYARVDIQLDDLLLDRSSAVADRGFPIRKGETFTLFIEQTRRLTPASMAIRISDPQGVRYLGVNNFRGSGDPAAKVMAGGYGDLNGEGELRALSIDTGCTDRSDDPQCYFEILNRRLDFVVGTMSPVEMWQGDDRTRGNWRFHVHKASRIVGTTSCFDALLRQNELSFFVERVGAR